MTKRIEILLTIALICLIGYLTYGIYERSRFAGGQPEEAVGVTYVLSESGEKLPSRYLQADEGKKPTVKDQGILGTCWAIAASSALETYFLPEERYVFSADHISLQNSFSQSQRDGGGYGMLMAYLTGWQGPVLEKDDPYGDGISRDDLLPVKHVQEIQALKNKDYTAIKRAVYEYGAVQSSIYMDLDKATDTSVYYNQLEYSYYYNGDEPSNHDVLIIGWDDNYFADRFNAETNRNGAFICQNSWGTQFGDEGIFYISYDDVNIGNNCIVYTRIEDSDNYDNLYQTDLCGQTGVLGYGDGNCFFANVYTSTGEENLEAVGFYTTGKNTEYEVYVMKNFESMNEFAKQKPLQKGKMEQQGYYTVKLPEAVPLETGERYAVVIRINTPGSSYPVAMEAVMSETTKTVDISDGEGYISHSGFVWKRTEEEHACNVCLKAYTSDR